MNPLPVAKQIATTLDGMPPRLAMQRLVYWGVIVIAGMIILLTALYGKLIPARIEAQLDQVFSERPWARPLARMDGQRVVLRGEIEPGYRFDPEIDEIRNISGVRQLDIELETTPRPAPTVNIEKTAEGDMALYGSMRGDDLEQLVRLVARANPTRNVQDRVKIDDRVSRPIWLDGLDPALESLNGLQSFTLYGWQDTVLIDGVAGSEDLRSDIKYTIPASLPDHLDINYQVRLAEAASAPKISLVAGWNGAALSGEVNNSGQVEMLAGALAEVVEDRSTELGESTDDADQQAGEQHGTLAVGLASNPRVIDSSLPRTVAELLPRLSRVHDLRIATSGDGLELWGRLDSSQDLGDVELALDAITESPGISRHLIVDPADRKPELSLFRDSNRLVISGRLPAMGIKNELLASLEQTDDIAQIEEFITIEPNIAFSPWIERWLNLMPALPETVFGITVAADSVLVSGQVADYSEKKFIGDALAAMFPGMDYVDWTTVGSGQFSGSDIKAPSEAPGFEH